MSTLEVVIVTWNSADTIEACLESCFQYCSNAGITVVDNASEDGTCERVASYKNVYLIANRENRGFAAAVNQGIARTGADNILLLNPDIVLLSPISALVQACNIQSTVIAAGCLEDSTGAGQAGFTVRRLPSALALAFEVLGLNRALPKNPVNRRYRYRDLPLKAAANVEQPAGAFLLFGRKLWLEIGGFDERFFPVWFEDVDFCKRALAHGLIRFVPAVRARHLGGASIARLEWSNRQRYWYASLLRYASKHFGPLKFRGVCGAVVLASVIRSLMGVFSQRTLQAITVYAEVGSLAMRGLVIGRASDPACAETYQQGSRVRTITSSMK